MLNMIKRMIESNRYTKDYINERVRVLYLGGDLEENEYLELKDMLSKII